MSGYYYFTWEGRKLGHELQLCEQIFALKKHIIICSGALYSVIWLGNDNYRVGRKSPGHSPYNCKKIMSSPIVFTGERKGAG
jgi:hypothetical protein